MANLLLIILNSGKNSPSPGEEDDFWVLECKFFRGVNFTVLHNFDHF